MDRIEIKQPDDWHCHFRDGPFLERTVADAARQFGRVIAMPNLKPPVETSEQAQAYHQRILDAIPSDCNLDPLMTLYLTANTSIDTIASATSIFGCKLYPKGATTNSQSGIDDILSLYPVFEAMQAKCMPLMIHGEDPSDGLDVFEREAAFIDRTLSRLLQDFPSLKIVLEHITTKDAVDFVRAGPERLGSTITAHHLLMNRNHLLDKGLRPHHYCLPVLKHQKHQRSLIEAATSGEPCFFLGTDSAPHTQDQKECAVGCAGIYTAHVAIELYAQVFEQENALDQLEQFASINGSTFYGLPVNTDTITLERKTQHIPDTLSYGSSNTLIPFKAGETISWTLA